MSLPEDTPLSAICAMEGHDWRGGGICPRCDCRLRCSECGQFVTEDALVLHGFECRGINLDEPIDDREAPCVECDGLGFVRDITARTVDVAVAEVSAARPCKSCMAVDS